MIALSTFDQDRKTCIVTFIHPAFTYCSTFNINPKSNHFPPSPPLPACSKTLLLLLHFCYCLLVVLALCTFLAHPPANSLELAFYTVRSWVSMVCNALHNLIFSATFLHPVYSSPAILSSCPFFVENAQNGLISGPLHLPFLCP